MINNPDWNKTKDIGRGYTQIGAEERGRNGGNGVKRRKAKDEKIPA